MSAKFIAALAAAAVVTVAAAASAQIPEVSPDGSLSNPAAPPPAPEPAAPAGPVIIPIGPDGRPVESEALDESGFYYNDQGGLTGGGSYAFGNGQSLYIGGPVPTTHVVRRGDTLWDITWFYFNNPFNWPKVWSYNPEISNPHWIYPGDQVRLYPEGEAPATVSAGDPDSPVDAPTALNRPARQPGNFELRQVAFVDKEDLEFAATVDGSTDEKVMLSLGDSIYLSYPKGKPPKVGERYAVYRPRKVVKHPSSGDSVGAYVKVIGELEVISVKKGKRARAIITDSTDVIERGAQVGPLQRQFVSVKPAEAEVDADGTIVAQLAADELIGARQAVIIDLGKKQGVKPGNRLFVVRRGDALDDLGGRVSNAGQDDRRFPARAIGEVLVVQTGKTSSMCLVTLVIQEVGIGDRVLMRLPKDDDDE